MPAEPLPGISAEQVESLRRHKLYANLTLLAAAGAWAIAQFVPLPAGFAGYLQAGGEAGMIGGLADWFAVTALFRHPLGLPIPHTNLIPRNQVRIAEGVARYIDNEFLRRDMLVEQLRKLDVAERIAALLRDGRDRARIVDGVIRLLPRVLRSDEMAFRQAIIAATHEGLSRADLKPALARLAHSIVEGEDLPVLVRDGCERLKELLERRRDWIAERVAERRRWFVPRFIDQRLTDRFVSGIVDHLDRLADPETEEGFGLQQWLMSLPAQIEHSDGMGSRLVEAVRNAARGPGLAHLIGAAWTELRDALIADIEAPTSKIRSTLDTIAGQLALELDSPSLRRDVNAGVEAFLVENVSTWRERIRAFIAETLTGQPPREFARRLEMQVGPDLQFIRINGTAIGCLVGLAIHYVNMRL
jgi:uncharacterized membrane-anchored protein YjiN (DUF445 family)